MSEASNTPLKKTPLHAMHVRLGARMAEFGGYDMPIQYADGIMAEHNWTRQHAGLFDVSHMGQAFSPCRNWAAATKRTGKSLRSWSGWCRPTSPGWRRARCSSPCCSTRMAGS